MIEPTREQRKEFWERCGLAETKAGFRGDLLGKNTITVPKSFPPLDLNNLFKYAVPVVIDKIMAEYECSSGFAYEILFKKWLQELQLNIPHPTLALFWAIWEVIRR